MNLSTVGPTGSSRRALATELSEARREPRLAGWPPLADVEILLSEPPQPPESWE